MWTPSALLVQYLGNNTVIQRRNVRWQLYFPILFHLYIAESGHWKETELYYAILCVQSMGEDVIQNHYIEKNYILKINIDCAQLIQKMEHLQLQ